MTIMGTSTSVGLPSQYGQLALGAAPSYLQGSQTSSLLGNLQGQQSPTSYVPGQGQAPMAASVPGSSQLVSGAQSGANSGYVDNAFYRKMFADTAANTGGQAVSSGPNAASFGGNYNTPGDLSGTNGSNSGGPTISGGPDQGWNNSIMYGDMNPSQQGNGQGGGGGSGGGGSSGGGGASGVSPLSGLNMLHPIQGPSGPPPNPIGNVNTGNMMSYGSPPDPSTGAQTNGSGSLNMQQGSALNGYQNSLGNQVLNTPGAYQQSPGYQFAVDQAMLKANQQGSSQGLLGSGSLAKAETNQASGMAMQDYNNWWNQQSGLVSNYQNQLAGLAGGQTGGAAANQLGQNLSANSAATGGNIAGLFGNQGNTGIGGMVNTGAAQANDIMHAGNTQAQVNANNSSTQVSGGMSLGTAF